MSRLAPFEDDEPLGLRLETEVSIQAQGSLIAFLGVDHHALDTALVRPVEAVHHQVGADALAAVARVDRKSLEVPPRAGSPGDGVTEDLAPFDDDGELAPGRGAARLSERGFVKAPEVVEGASVDVEHGTTMPRSAVSDGSGRDWGLVVERSGQQMQPLEQPEAAFEEGLCIERGERGRNGAFDAPCIELINAIDHVIRSGPSTVARRTDQRDEPISLPGNDS